MIAFRAAIITLLISVFASAQEKTNGRPVVGNPHLESVQLSSLDTDSAEFALCFGGTALKSVTIKSIFLERLTVDGVPMHAPPIHEVMKLKEGKEIEGFPTVNAHVAFREVNSLQPLRDIVTDGKARIHASVLVQLELNPLEMFALRAMSAWAAFEIDTDQPVNLPGGLLTQAAAFAALTAAEPVWILSNEAREWRRQHSALAQRAEEAMERNLASIECSFSVRSEHGSVTEVHNRAMGFLLPSGRILTTAEAVEPWKFDSSLLEAFSQHKASLVDDSVEVKLKLAGSPVEFSTVRGEIRVLGEHNRGKLMVATGRQASYRLQLRDDADNLTELEVKGLRQTPPVEQAAGIVDDSGWQPAVVFYESSHPLLFTTEARLENGRIALKEPVAPSAFGSPVWVENGIAGIVQEDYSAADANALQKAFPAEKF